MIKSIIAIIVASVISVGTVSEGAVAKAQKEYRKDYIKSIHYMKATKKISKKNIKTAGGEKKFFRIYKIKKGDKIYKKIHGKSLPKSGYSVSNIRYIKVLYRDFKGKRRIGEIIVHKSIAPKTKDVFYKLYKKKYRIRKMKLVDNYFPKHFSDRQAAARAADDRSMDDDNTSAFNYRYVLGTSTLSKHSYGKSIDINPYENPYCFKKGGRWVAASNQRKSQKYCNRTPGKSRKHMIQPGSYIVKVFRSHGFRWLGTGGSMRDYQHFEY